MGLWEFLRQWRPSRVTVGVTASIFLHLAVVALVLWGGKILPRSRWDVKRGDPLIVELPKPQEPASAGSAVGTSGTARAAEPTGSAEPAESTGGQPQAAGPRARGAPARTAGARGTPGRQRAPQSRAAGTQAGGAAAEPPEATDPGPAPAEPPPQGRRAGDPVTGRPAGAPAAPARPSRRAPQVASVPPAAAAGDRRCPTCATALRRGGGGSRAEGRGGHRGRADSARLRRSALQRLPRADPPAHQGEVGLSVRSRTAAARHCEYKTASLDRALRHPQGRPRAVRRGRAQLRVRDLRRLRGERHQAGFAVSAGAARDDATVRAGSTGVPISARFMYMVESSLTNLLR